MQPTDQPTISTMSPTDRPSRSPLSGNGTHAPTLYPSGNPTFSPTVSPTAQLFTCLNNGREIHAWYDGDSIDLTNDLWIDKSGNNNTGEMVVNTGIELFDGTDISNAELYLNDQPIVTGTHQTQITFNVELNPSRHTVFNLAKYRIGSGYKARILQGNTHNSLFGFWNGRSGIAYYNYWITANDDRFGTEWVLSTQQGHLYRGNAIDLTINSQSTGLSNTNKLMINNGVASGEVSDFALSELIVFNEILDLGEIECIENYFNDRYLLSFTNNPTLPSTSPTTRPSKSPLSVNETYGPTTLPTTAPTPPYDYTNYVLTCDQIDQCQSMTVQCPKFALCNISCLNHGACRYVECNYMSIHAHY